jgi:hypothetical protein
MSTNPEILITSTLTADGADSLACREALRNGCAIEIRHPALTTLAWASVVLAPYVPPRAHETQPKPADVVLYVEAHIERPNGGSTYLDDRWRGAAVLDHQLHVEVGQCSNFGGRHSRAMGVRVEQPTMSAAWAEAASKAREALNTLTDLKTAQDAARTKHAEAYAAALLA